MTSLEKLYQHAPTFIQNGMTSIRGLQLRQMRYTDHTEAMIEKLNDSQYWDIQKQQAYQLEQLQELVSHSIRYVEYYQDRYKKLGINNHTITNLQDLHSLPIIKKSEFRQHNEKFFSSHKLRQKMWKASTSGTTGTPLSAYHTHEDMQSRIAFLERLYLWYNPKRWRKRASFTGKLIVNPEKNSPPFFRINRAVNQHLFSSHHLSESNLDVYIKELHDFQPEQIDGIASSIYVVANHIIRNGKSGILKPSVVIPTSETIWPHVRQSIETGFNCNVANQYGSQEGAPLAYECPDGGFHICPESGIFEILRPDDTPCEANELGHLVITSFLSKGTPLIRYDIGDLASWSDKQCTCGRTMPLLHTIEGRIDDMFYTEDRGIVPRIDSAFKSMPPAIIETQVAQIDINHFDVRLVVDPAIYQSFMADELVNHLHDYLGHSIIIRVQMVDRIKRTRGGKMQAMVNEAPEIKSTIMETWNAENHIHLT